MNLNLSPTAWISDSPADDYVVRVDTPREAGPLRVVVALKPLCVDYVEDSARNLSDVGRVARELKGLLQDRIAADLRLREIHDEIRRRREATR